MTIYDAATIKGAPRDVYKFLRMASGEWRFWLVESMLSHREAAKGEAVSSAGCISLWDINGEFVARMEDPWSSTLGMGCLADDEAALEGVLGTRLRGRLG